MYRVTIEVRKVLNSLGGMLQSFSDRAWLDLYLFHSRPPLSGNFQDVRSRACEETVGDVAPKEYTDNTRNAREKKSLLRVIVCGLESTLCVF